MLQRTREQAHLRDGEELLQGDRTVDVQRVQHFPCTSSTFLQLREP